MVLYSLRGDLYMYKNISFWLRTSNDFRYINCNSFRFNGSSLFSEEEINVGERFKCQRAHVHIAGAI